MQQADVLIASGASLSNAVDLQGFIVCGVVMPSSWTTANLTFAGAGTDADGTEAATYLPIYTDAGVEYTVTAAASRIIQIDPSKLAGVRYLKVRSGTNSSAVNQGGDRSLLLVLRAE